MHPMIQTCARSCHWRLIVSIMMVLLHGVDCWSPSSSKSRTAPLLATKLHYSSSNSTSAAAECNEVRLGDVCVVPMAKTTPKDVNANLRSSGMGDIMGRTNLLRETGHSLSDLYGIRNPLDRMLITANGNLQRLFASYYDTEVSVQVLDCTCRRADLPAVWDRTVELRLLRPSNTFVNTTSQLLLCTAESEIILRSSMAAHAISSEIVGIGQWFRHTNVLPTFELHGAGYSDDDGALWRRYTLNSDDMQCNIREDFAPGVWNLMEDER